MQKKNAKKLPFSEKLPKIAAAILRRDIFALQIVIGSFALIFYYIYLPNVFHSQRQNDYISNTKFKQKLYKYYNIITQIKAYVPKKYFFYLNNIKKLELFVLDKVYLHIVLKLCDCVIIYIFDYLITINDQLRLRYYQRSRLSKRIRIIDLPSRGPIL